MQEALKTANANAAAVLVAQAILFTLRTEGPVPT